MPALFNRYQSLKPNKRFFLQVATGVLLMCAALFFNNYANSYISVKPGAAVNDIILDNIPAMNVEGIFLEGFLSLIGIVILLCLHRPARIPFVLKTSALFILMRTFFIILTHIGPPIRVFELHAQNFLERVISGPGEDLFFSGHTGWPFLMALVFWQTKHLRIFFLLASVFFGAVVLLGQLHYSIDVFSAFFIASPKFEP